jgi:protein-disulfide isomerase
MLRTTALLCALALAALLAPCPATAQDTPPGPALTPAQRAEVEAAIAAYIEANPDRVLAALEAGHARQMEAAHKAAGDKVQALTAYFESPAVPAAGNLDDPDVTIVEFFDYNCGHCKTAFRSVQHVLNADPGVRVLFAEMPILHPSSREAGAWALAAHRQGKYFAFHAALMEHTGPISPTTLERLAGEAGLDVAQAKADAASPEIAADLDRAMEVASEVGIRGTPAFVVGRTLYPGALGPEDLARAVEAARGHARAPDGEVEGRPLEVE